MLWSDGKDECRGGGCRCGVGICLWNVGLGGWVWLGGVGAAVGVGGGGV